MWDLDIPQHVSWTLNWSCQTLCQIALSVSHLTDLIVLLNQSKILNFLLQISSVIKLIQVENISENFIVPSLQIAVFPEKKRKKDVATRTKMQKTLENLTLDFRGERDLVLSKWIEVSYFLYSP